MKRSLTLFVSTGTVLLLLLAVVIWANSKQGKQYQPGDVVDGQHSKVDSHEYHLITEQMQWSDIWSRHHGDEAVGAIVPVIDFSRHMVVAIFLGDVSQCSGIDVQSITRRKADDHFEIRYRPAWYSAESIGDPEKDSHAGTPFGFIVVRRSAKVSLFEDVQSRRDAAPEYKLQTKLLMDSPAVKRAPR